jgi:hypothetical protein
MRRSLRDRASYANVVSTLAVFLALGGTSYAVTLPRNSVGPSQLQSDSVGRSEIRRGAVRSGEIRNRSVRTGDISFVARRALRGQQGPPGPTFFQSVNSSGGGAVGNGTSVEEGSSFNTRVVGFSRSVANCVAVASLTTIPGGPVPDPPGNGHVTAEPTADGRVLVETFAPDGSAAQYPFNLIVAC